MSCQMIYLALTYMRSHFRNNGHLRLIFCPTESPGPRACVCGIFLAFFLGEKVNVHHYDRVCTVSRGPTFCLFFLSFHSFDAADRVSDSFAYLNRLTGRTLPTSSVATCLNLRGPNCGTSRVHLHGAQHDVMSRRERLSEKVAQYINSNKLLVVVVVVMT